MRLTIALLCLLHFSLAAIDLNLPLSATQNATNGLVLTNITTSVTAIQPALIKPGIETSVTYLYSLRELPYYFLHSAYQFGKLGCYFGNSHLAHDLYTENQSYLAVNYRFKDLSFGLQTRYLYNKVANYSTLSKLLYDAGISYSFAKYTLAFAVKNLTQSTNYGMDLPSFFVWEANYSIHDRASLSVGIEKQIHYDFLYRLAAYYQIVPFFSLLTSYQYAPQRIGAGAVINYDKWNVVYSIRTHQHLDLTHFISLGYAFSP
jgi:hypothetical protein